MIPAALKSFAVSRATQLVARYVAVGLVALSARGMAVKGIDAAVVAQWVVAVGLVFADHLIHDTRWGQALLARLQQLLGGVDMAAVIQDVQALGEAAAMHEEQLAEQAQQMHLHADAIQKLDSQQAAINQAIKPALSVKT